MTLTLRKPFDGEFPITQKFGAKYLYFGKALSHEGLDFACPSATPILAAHDGEIVRAFLNPSKKGYGNEVRISGENVMTQYAHLSTISVKLGDKVKAGDPLGISGNSGFCLGKTGFHLHFGAIVDKKWVDPEPLLDGNFVAPAEAVPVNSEGETPVGKNLESEILVKATVDKCKEIFDELCAECGDCDEAKKVADIYFEKLNKHFQIG